MRYFRFRKKKILLARLGLDNVDAEGPWIPDQEDIVTLRDELDAALGSDYRLLVYHHGLQIEELE
jgi:hypothetical protein